MIILDQLTKVLTINGKVRNVLSGVSMAIPTNRRIALLGPSYEDNKALLDILAGKTLPNSGRIIRKARVSFPVGDLQGFDADLSIRSNVAYVARLYGTDVKTTVAFVERVAKLGPAFDRRFRDINNAARAELGQILSYSIPFDLYLLNRDAASPQAMESTAFALLEARIAQSAGMIAASGRPEFARERCEVALVLHNGQLRAFNDVEQALSVATRLR